MGYGGINFTRVSKVDYLYHVCRKVKDLRHNEDTLITDLVQQQKIAKDSLRVI